MITTVDFLSLPSSTITDKFDQYAYQSMEYRSVSRKRCGRVVSVRPVGHLHEIYTKIHQIYPLLLRLNWTLWIQIVQFDRFPIFGCECAIACSHVQPALPIHAVFSVDSSRPGINSTKRLDPLIT
jgi:hypothetical protein